MEGGRKRQQTQTTTKPIENADIAALATVGMRIRKAVAEGYSVPNDAQYMSPLTHNYQDYQLNGYANTGTRVPLPLHLSEPPSLSYLGLTLDSTSSFSEWDRRLNEGPVQSIVEETRVKRKHEVDEEQVKDYGIEFDNDF